MIFYKTIALLLLSAFYISYFAKMLMLKKQNIQGNILGKGQKPQGSVNIEVALRFTTFLIAPIQFSSVIWDKAIWSLPMFPTMCEDGLILMFFGVVVFLLAIITMRNNWRAGYSYEQDTQLVTSGVYKFSRNPAFVGFDLLYIGCALAFPNIINATITLAAVVLLHLQILGEEKFLAGKFGTAYLNYKTKVRRYI
ncbi:MAG: isoprenylcysteine carboxylmethyltransferase family protein [Dehalococcoidia bacterium]|nr:isoprenylcysteine carboxylmethyltransferase family protein [Dehalococcoidia bacterium]